MRHTSAAVLAALALVLSGLTISRPVSPAAAADQTQIVPVATHDADHGADQAAQAALETAESVLEGSADSAPGPADEEASPTLALRDLFVALPDLAGSDRRKADGLLARPTSPNDPNGDAYTVPSKRTCSAQICVHWVPRTADAPPDRGWVTTTMKVMKKVWAQEIGRLGFRRPVSDGGRGGNAKFDVYLKDVGAEGFYGYCAPERRKPGHKWLASGYCVLDDDFARRQFGAKPMDSLRVTAAHEFFHAVQFAYDYGEDRWLMEGTATWIEERVADNVNDNRQYLRHGQVREPGESLDLFDPAGFDQYGNWAFFEYLSTSFGTKVVRRIWDRAGAHQGAPDLYSTRAVKAALPRSTSWPEVFRAYAAGNTIPGTTYPEGKSWPEAPMSSRHTLGAGKPRAAKALRIDHMAARHVSVRPADTLRQRTWMLRVDIDAPQRKSEPAAYVLVHKRSGSVVRRPVRLDDDGDGQITFRFTSRSVAGATLTLANASTRFNCWEQDTTYSCQGRPTDQGKRFGYTMRLLDRS